METYMPIGKDNQRRDGKGSVNHNTRAFTAKNVDMKRSGDNVELCRSDIKEVYYRNRPLRNG